MCDCNRLLAVDVMFIFINIVWVFVYKYEHSERWLTGYIFSLGVFGYCLGVL